jgi:hypothetical protein
MLSSYVTLPVGQLVGIHRDDEPFVFAIHNGEPTGYTVYSDKESGPSVAFEDMYATASHVNGPRGMGHFPSKFLAALITDQIQPSFYWGAYAQGRYGCITGTFIPTPFLALKFPDLTAGVRTPVPSPERLGLANAECIGEFVTYAEAELYLARHGLIDIVSVWYGSAVA